MITTIIGILCGLNLARLIIGCIEGEDTDDYCG